LRNTQYIQSIGFASWILEEAVVEEAGEVVIRAEEVVEEAEGVVQAEEVTLRGTLGTLGTTTRTRISLSNQTDLKTLHNSNESQLPTVPLLSSLTDPKTLRNKVSRSSIKGTNLFLFPVLKSCFDNEHWDFQHQTFLATIMVMMDWGLQSSAVRHHKALRSISKCQLAVALILSSLAETQMLRSISKCQLAVALLLSSLIETQALSNNSKVIMLLNNSPIHRILGFPRALAE
jgi:hypothetical protein